MHPTTGRTANLKLSKLKLARWAEAYEREHGLDCEERIRSNAERDSAPRGSAPWMQRLSSWASATTHRVLKAPSEQKPRGRVPRVKDRKSQHRRIWLARKDVVDRMRRMRAEAEVFHKIERNAIWERHKKERDALWLNSKARFGPGTTAETSGPKGRPLEPLWQSPRRLPQKTKAHCRSAAPHLTTLRRSAMSGHVNGISRP